MRPARTPSRVPLPGRDRRRAPFGGLAWLPLDELLALLLSLALLSGSDGPSNAGTTAMVSAAADGTSQGSVLGVTQGAGSLGRTVGPPAVTVPYVLCYWVPFALGAALTAGVLGTLVTVARRSE